MTEDGPEWHAAVEECSRAPYILGPATILDHAKTKTDFLIENAIPAKAITLLVGQPGSSKSWLAYDLAIRVARGESWLGRASCGPQRVLVLSYDNPPAECGRRFLRLGLKRDDLISFHVPDGPTYLRIGATKQDGSEAPAHSHAELLRAVIRQLRVGLVVVDSFRQAHVLDENSSNDMGKVMAEVKTWVSAGAAVVIVHHSTLSESGEVRARGSGEITASADAVIAVHGGKAKWSKVRSWRMPAGLESEEFEVIDRGELTEVRSVDQFAGLDPQLIERVRTHLELHPTATGRELQAALGGKTAMLSRAKRAVEAGR